MGYCSSSFRHGKNLQMEQMVVVSRLRAQPVSASRPVAYLRAGVWRDPPKGREARELLHTWFPPYGIAGRALFLLTLAAFPLVVGAGIRRTVVPWIDTLWCLVDARRETKECGETCFGPVDALRGEVGRLREEAGADTGGDTPGPVGP
jgi:hypothetical protein